jgi:hypothetical protein
VRGLMPSTTGQGSPFDRDCRGRRRRRLAASLLAVAALFSIGAIAAPPRASAGGQVFRSDAWVTECEPGAAACSITAPFSDEQDGHQGSFALVVMLQAGGVAIVGRPYPTRAVLRVDRNRAIECRETRYCLFPGGEAGAFIKELTTGSLVYVDVFAGRAAFHFSLTTKGYRAGLAKIGAWGYRFPDK